MLIFVGFHTVITLANERFHVIQMGFVLIIQRKKRVVSFFVIQIDFTNFSSLKMVFPV